jgi:hypothetical protein
MTHLCTSCNHTLTNVEPGRGVCPHCGAEFDFDPAKGQRVHAYPFSDVLRPRGGVMLNDSLSLAVFEAMVAAWEHWTDVEYADDPEPAELRAQIIANAKSEVEIAIAAFVDKFGGSDSGTNQEGE